MNDLMAILIGVLCGIAAGIPTSVLVLVALAQHDARRAAAYHQMMEEQQPTTERPPLVWIVEQTGERTVEIGPADYRALLN